MVVGPRAKPAAHPRLALQNDRTRHENVDLAFRWPVQDGRFGVAQKIGVVPPWRSGERCTIHQPEQRERHAPRLRPSLDRRLQPSLRVIAHDDGQNKGRVSAIYSLSGRNTSGCFAVSEWHPGGESCSRYLPRRVPITLTHGSPADPTVTHVFIDQSRNGGGWNLLGFFYFAQGFGQVVSSNAGTDQCDRSVCCARTATALTS